VSASSCCCRCFCPRCCCPAGPWCAPASAMAEGAAAAEPGGCCVGEPGPRSLGSAAAVCPSSCSPAAGLSCCRGRCGCCCQSSVGCSCCCCSGGSRTGGSCPGVGAARSDPRGTNSGPAADRPARGEAPKPRGAAGVPAPCNGPSSEVSPTRSPSSRSTSSSPWLFRSSPTPPLCATAGGACRAVPGAGTAAVRCGSLLDGSGSPPGPLEGATCQSAAITCRQGACTLRRCKRQWGRAQCSNPLKIPKHCHQEAYIAEFPCTDLFIVPQKLREQVLQRSIRHNLDLAVYGPGMITSAFKLS
jgi:hypothetical protein